MLKDHLGSASVLLTKSDGKIETNGEQRYYPFGESRNASAGLKTAHLCTGQIDTRSGAVPGLIEFHTGYLLRSD